MTDQLMTLGTRGGTPQTEQATANEVQNNAGGFVFQVDDDARLRRFLILGVTGGTFYVSAKDLAKQNMDDIKAILARKGTRFVDEVVAVSDGGLAPNQKPALFALALACAAPDDETRKYALSVIPEVARTATDLFQFIAYAELHRGWGRGLRDAVSAWFTDKNVDQIAYQAVKYRQRNGWTQRDTLRLGHPKVKHYFAGDLGDPDARCGVCGKFSQVTIHQDVTEQDVAVNDIFKWITHGTKSNQPLIKAYTKVTKPGVSAEKVIKQIEKTNLSWEMLTDEVINDANVWRALLDNDRVPQHALRRQLPRLTRMGLLDPLGTDSRMHQVCALLMDQDRLRKSRTHPIQLLIAQKTYAEGRGRGSTTWDPVAPVVDALNTAFYASFGNVVPANKRTLIAVDVSGSMDWESLEHAGGMTPRELAAAMCLVTAATEPAHQIMAFSHELVPLNISPTQRLADVVQTTSDVRMGGTDCSLPMLMAMDRDLAVDTFVILTDSETWAGRMHPMEALVRYRAHSGIPARLVVVGMTATEFTIADPNDAGSLDVCGFDGSLPNLISAFSRGDI